MSSADVLSTQALDKRTLNRCVGIMTFPRVAPEVADHTALSEADLSQTQKGGGGCGGKHWDSRRWEIMTKL